MKRNGLNFLLLAGIAGFFLYFAQSIVEITMFQLRLDISRRQLLNYELASNILNSRFDNLSRETDDFDGEVRMSVLESSVLNSELKQSPLEMGAYEWGGLAAVNFIRLLNFKGFLSLQDDADRLLLLQYAFFMQRKKRYDRAIEGYVKLEDQLGVDKEDDRAFVLLHSGYSYALAGKIDDAVNRLGRVRQDFAGTHFASSANVLLDFLLNEGRRALRDAENPNLPTTERAAAYYRAGRFLKVVSLLEPDIQASGAETKLIYARSLEESGRVKDSTEVYKQLVESGAGDEIMRKANRRLLLLGNFYSAGEDVKEYAERQAYLMGDSEAVQQINERLVYFDKPKFFEHLKEAGEIEVPEEMIKEIRDNLEDTLPAEEVAALPVFSKPPEEVIAAAGPETQKAETAQAPATEPGQPAAPSTPAAQKEDVAAVPPPAAPKSQPQPQPQPQPHAVPQRPAAPPVYRRYWQPYVPRPAAPAKDVRIRFKDGREMRARNVEIQGDLMRVQQGGTTIEMDFTLVEKVEGQDGDTGVALTLEGDETLEGVSFEHDDDEITLRTADGETKRVARDLVRIRSANLPKQEGGQ